MTHVTTIRSGRRAGFLVLPLMAAVAIAGCTRNEDRVLFDGVHYKEKAKAASKEDRRLFVVTVRRVDRGFNGAVKAGEYEATRYCIQNFGTSDIEWYQGPDGDRGSIPVEGNKIKFTGKCVTW